MAFWDDDAFHNKYTLAGRRQIQEQTQESGSNFWDSRAQQEEQREQEDQEVPTRSLWDAAGEFSASFNERFLGGLARGAIRLGGFVSPSTDDEDVQKAIDTFAPEVGTEAAEDSFLASQAKEDSLGGTLGTVAKGVVDVGTMFGGGAAVRGGIKGIKGVQALAQGGKVARGASKAAPFLGESGAASVIHSAQERGRGNEVNLGQELATGAGIDVAANLAFRGLGAGARGLRNIGNEGFAKIPGAGDDSAEAIARSEDGFQAADDAVEGATSPQNAQQALEDPRTPQPWQPSETQQLALESVDEVPSEPVQQRLFGDMPESSTPLTQREAAEQLELPMTGEVNPTQSPNIFARKSKIQAEMTGQETFEVTDTVAPTKTGMSASRADEAQIQRHLDPNSDYEMRSGRGQLKSVDVMVKDMDNVRIGQEVDGQVQLGENARNVFRPMTKGVANAGRMQMSLADSVIGAAENVGLVLPKGKRGKATLGKKLYRGLDNVPDSHYKMDDEMFAAKYGMNIQETRFVKETRKILDSWLEFSNAERAKMGLSAIPRREGYIAHLKKSAKWYESSREAVRTGDISVEQFNDFVVPDERGAFFMNERIANNIDLNDNLFELLEIYSTSMSKSINYTPVIQHMKARNKLLRHHAEQPVPEGLSGSQRQTYLKRQKVLSDQADQWDEVIKGNLIGAEHPMDAALGITRGGAEIPLPGGGGVEAADMFDKLQMMRVRGALGGNIVWSLITQPSSMAFTLKDAGVRDTIMGTLQYFGNRGVIDPSDVAAIKSSKSGTKRSARFSNQNLDERFNSSINSGYTDSANDMISKLSNFMEDTVTGMSYSAGLRAGKRAGYSGTDLETFADMMAASSQSLYNKELNPLLMNSRIFKTAMPFQTFFMQAFNHAKELAGAGGWSRTKGERFMSAAKLMGGVWMFNQVSQQLRGSDVTTAGSFVPIAGQVIDEAVEGIRHPGERRAVGRSPIAPFEDVSQVVRGVSDWVNHGDTDQLRRSALFFGMGGFGLGGSGQVARTLEGYESFREGVSETAAGTHRFDIEQTPGNLAASVVGGQYTTREGRDYIESGLTAVPERYRDMDWELEESRDVMALEEDMDLGAIPERHRKDPVTGRPWTAQEIHANRDEIQRRMQLDEQLTEMGLGSVPEKYRHLPPESIVTMMQLDAQMEEIRKTIDDRIQAAMQRSG